MSRLLGCVRAAMAGAAMLAPALAWCGPAVVFANAPGPHAVGLRVVQQVDASRSYMDHFDIVTGNPVAGMHARPIQTLVWYPAAAGGQALRYGDYIALARSEEVFDGTGRPVLPVARRAQAVEAVSAQPMRAVRDALPAPGRFPVVIYAPSFGAIAAENADLCEYLASQGYVVMASASMGAHSRAMTPDLEGVEAQVGDIEFLVGYAATLAQADAERIAVVGFSWGGLSNVAAAAKDGRIRALVSLDGTIRYDNKTVKAIAYMTPARIEAPYLFVASRPATLEQMNVDRKEYDLSRNFLNELKYADLWLATMPAMAHEDFSSFFLRVLPDDASAAGYTRPEAIVAHGWVERYVERFLDATLRHDADARAFLDRDPAANGVPAHFMQMVGRPAEGSAPTLENIAAALARRGFDHGDDVIREMHLRDADAQPAEDVLVDWARRVSFAGDALRAVHVHEFALRLWPASADLHDGLGEAWLARGDKARAEAAFRAALALAPDHPGATRHLRALTAK